MAENSLPVIKKINTPMKIAKDFYMLDILFILVYMVVMIQFETYVHPWLKYPYYILNLIWAIHLTGKSKYNKGKRNWQTILYWLTMDKTVYHSESTVKKEIRGEKI